MARTKAPANPFDALLGQHTRMTQATQPAADMPAKAPEKHEEPSALRFGDIGPSKSPVQRSCRSCPGSCVWQTRCRNCGDHLCTGECALPPGVCLHCGVADGVHEQESSCPFSEWRDWDPREHEKKREVA